ncbi:rRNA methyltransferase 1, mitochondrial isoform X2 [Osmerus eperlanus]|uniref:rRNA methyltransferase 1, mitochondrial isoform X2 n=1 Tax=Osmerus eperlanus TaxID=29151 RepID=UPI002E140169
MATWNLTLHCSRLFVYNRLFAQVADLRVSSQFASYHPTSTLQRRDGEAKPDVSKRRSVLPSAGVQHSPAGDQHSPAGDQHSPAGDQHRPAVSGTWRGHHGADDIPEIPASKKVWRAEAPGPREGRSPGSPGGPKPRIPGRAEAPGPQEGRPWAEGRVSSELQKLSLDDFPKARERVGKDSKEDRNSETLFGVSPCLLALTMGRRRARRLYVKEGDASKRASVQQVCEEAHRRGVQIQRDEPPKPPSAGSAPPLWLVLDAVQDPMNLGAIIRSAYFLGVDRIASSLHNSCPLTPVVSKASSGVMEVMKVYGYESLADMLKVKVSQGWQVVGTVGAEGRGFPAPVLCCSEFHMTRPTLLLMGGEGGGLSPELCLQCEVLLTVPPLRALAPGVESLNVSVATGILLYSLLSSRRGGQR